MSTWIRPRLSLLLAAALMFAPLAAVASPADAERTLDGRVFEADLETPMAGVSVQVTDQAKRELLAKAVTDDEGRFHLEGLEARAYTLVLLDADSQPLAAAEVDVARHSEVALAVPEARPGEGQAAPGQSGATGGGIAAWLASPVGATVALVAGATVVAVAAESATDDDEPAAEVPVSPSEPVAR